MVIIKYNNFNHFIRELPNNQLEHVTIGDINLKQDHFD